MIIKCLAIDDEPLALSKMSNYISKTRFLELAGACRSGFDAINLLSSQKIDLMFVDINMPDINGLDFVKSIPSKPQIIFTTAFGEYAIEGFKLDALDY
jgi:two-component system LytT family response regulator